MFIRVKPAVFLKTALPYKYDRNAHNQTVVDPLAPSMPYSSSCCRQLCLLLDSVCVGLAVYQLLISINICPSVSFTMPFFCVRARVCVCLRSLRRSVSSLDWSGVSECESDLSWLEVEVAGSAISVFSDLLSDLLSASSTHPMGFLASGRIKRLESNCRFNLLRCSPLFCEPRHLTAWWAGPLLVFFVSWRPSEA